METPECTIEFRKWKWVQKQQLFPDYGEEVLILDFH